MMENEEIVEIELDSDFDDREIYLVNPDLEIPEITTRILSFLSPEEIIRIQRVSRMFCKTGRSNFLWKSIVEDFDDYITFFPLIKREFGEKISFINENKELNIYKNFLQLFKRYYIKNQFKKRWREGGEKEGEMRIELDLVSKLIFLSLISPIFVLFFPMVILFCLCTFVFPLTLYICVALINYDHLYYEYESNKYGTWSIRERKLLSLTPISDNLFYCFFVSLLSSVGCCFCQFFSNILFCFVFFPLQCLVNYFFCQCVTFLTGLFLFFLIGFRCDFLDSRLLEYPYPLESCDKDDCFLSYSPSFFLFFVTKLFHFCWEKNETVFCCCWNKHTNEHHLLTLADLWMDFGRQFHDRYGYKGYGDVFRLILLMDRRSYRKFGGGVNVQERRREESDNQDVWEEFTEF